MAWIGAVVSVAIVLMKIVPGVPGSFTRRRVDLVYRMDALGSFWLLRRLFVETRPYLAFGSS